MEENKKKNEALEIVPFIPFISNDVDKSTIALL